MVGKEDTNVDTEFTNTTKAEKVQDFIDEAVKGIDEANQVLDLALPVLVPKAEELLERVAPLLDKVLGHIWSGKSFDGLVIMGNASYLARALLEKGMDPEEAAEKAVECARKIVELSRT